MAHVYFSLFSLVASVLLALNFVKIILKKRNCPLSKIPNAGFGAAYSRLAWAFPREFCGKITLDLPGLHEKLGPFVRIGPNEVSFYSLDVYDAVHKVGSKFKKDPKVYGEFVQGGNPALFSITDREEHSKRRRLMGQLFNRSKMQNLERLMTHNIDRFIQAIQRTNGTVDLIPACRALEADIISEFSFGQVIGAIDKFSRGQELAMVAKNDEKARWMALLTEFPALCHMWEQVEDLLFSVTGFRSSYSLGLQDFHEWCQTTYRLTVPDLGLAKENTTRSRFPNLIETMIKSNLAPETALAEARENLGPGTDTTSATLAHIVWALAHNEQFQEELYSDLTGVSFSVDMSTLEAIAKLRACVKEGIRWTGAAAAMLPRIVPEGGFEMHGTFIPQGTVLSSSPIWYLYDPVAFPYPKEYDPYRWLTPDGAAIRHDDLHDRFYIPFSKGTNICMGAHFSYFELYLSVSQLVRHFRIRLDRKLLHPSYSPQPGELLLGKFHRVPLPARREWVAAVPTEKLIVKLVPRVM